MRLKPNTAILDIETTSLDADTGYVICIGLMTLNEDKTKTFFAPSPASEKSVITSFLRTLEKCHVYLTWNGSAFDVPFLTARALKYSIDFSPLYRRRHVDLAEVARRTLKLSSYSMWNVCRYLGIEQGPSTLNSDIPRLYLGYIRGNRRFRAEIVRHCLDDLRRTRAVMKRMKSLIHHVHHDLPTLP
ncbi:MAG: ribonuclease H-like domain-containing protein [Aigarchaeota archaeon]|nr:ribonuclease H-like domain-containing protein [Aigarchaeota archaeon]MDW8092675.1 ribonuclease H-like domain-containing protein [Nitrososphaerota archaeon]